MSLLHRNLFASFVAEIEPIVLKTLESAAVLAGPAAPLVTEALQIADAAVRANNSGEGQVFGPQAAQPVSPFPAPAAAPAPVPAPAVAVAAVAQPTAPAAAPDFAALKARVAALQAEMASIMAALG
jgi:hypothetical protein